MKNYRRTSRSVLSLCTGAGGLDIGLETAGFSTAICVELDDDARRTLKANRPQWIQAEPGDIHRITPRQILTQASLRKGELTLLTCGPPCQPFSKSAYWANGGTRGLSDPRAGALRVYLNVVEVALPRVLLLENVRGLAANGKDGGALHILQEGLRKINRKHGTAYELHVINLNAADYGVPQSRERVFILASIDGRTFKVPSKTHGLENHLEPYRSAWDAIGDLDEPNDLSDLIVAGKWADLLKSILEGKNYLWHTPRGGGEPLFGWRTKYWSFLLKLSKRQPSWTIQAVPGPATGPFHWRNRLLSIEELARLQTFPHGFKFSGNRRSAHRQIGNAVPCAIGELLGIEIRRQFLDERDLPQRLTLIPERREYCPRPYPPQAVPRKYMSLKKNHRDHPGTGLGPGRVWESVATQSTIGS